MRFRTLFLFFALAELFSLAAYFFPLLNTVGFVEIVVATLVLSLFRLEYGLYFVLAELILGGKGYLFSLPIGLTTVSLRMGLFVIVMAVWLSKLRLADLRTQFKEVNLMKWWGVLWLVIVWGMVVGLVRRNNFGDLFFDANGYFYSVLVLPFIWVYGSARSLLKLPAVFFAATTWVAVKTLFAVYLFTHAGNNYIAANLIQFYRWVRDTGVGEITWIDGNFARVFFQSHIYNLIAFIMLLVLFLAMKYEKLSLTTRTWKLLGLIALNAAVVVVSLSRSFWVGAIVGLAVAGILCVRRLGYKGFFNMSYHLGFSFVAAALLLLVVARFPFPRPSTIDLGAAARARLESGDAGQSRWNLLPPLARAALENPIIGSGFGKTVTYISNDPRIRQVDPRGSYTTYAFEWGWLDLFLKLGLVGLAGYLTMLVILARTLYQRHREDILFIAPLAVLFAIAAVNIFTPYLNHPLGFGALILLTVASVLPSLMLDRIA